MSSELFSSDNHEKTAKPVLDRVPLAERMRPQTLDEYFGQQHLVGEGKLLRRIILADQLHSAIFYGPPGTGKTSLVRVIANVTDAYFDRLNAVSSNSADIKRIIENAVKRKAIRPDKKSILFIDEIHRFNKAQQDLLMPAVENGDIILLGATTHNPSFSINGPLLSRSLVFELFPLTGDDLKGLIKRAVNDSEKGYGHLNVKMDDDAISHFCVKAGGDARKVLNAIDTALKTTDPGDDGVVYITDAIAEECIQRRMIRYDRDEDNHYDTISAFIKSVRGSDPDAAMYWLAKMLYAGEDPLFIARRIVILASEDIGNADPHALTVALNALRAIEFVGMPEGRIVLGQAVSYLATAPKSNAAYMAINEALNDVKSGRVYEVPLHLRDSSSSINKKHQEKSPYKYPHNYKGNFISQNYGGTGKMYYNPTDNGYEQIIKKRLVKWRNNNLPNKGVRNDSQ